MFFGSKKVSTDVEAINNLLTRGVEEVFVKENLEKKLRSGKQLRVKLGIDPTAPNVHIGHAIVFRKLREFQELGHKVVIIVGDFTAQIGDPSDKLSKRPMLTPQEIAKNLASYSKQLGKIVDLKQAEFVHNSSWLSKLKFDEVCRLAESFTVQQMTARRNFKDRIEKGIEISLREFMYPLMQGYDSYAVKADVELGGFDQLFNLKAGRAIQKHYGQEEQDILITVMLLGTDGNKMSKSVGNVINISEVPDHMFGKVMSLRDDLIKDYFLLCTDLSLAEIEKIKARLGGGENPRDIKLELAEKIVSTYHDKEIAKKARTKFIETFSEKKVPDDVLTARTTVGTLIVDVVVSNGIVQSKSEWRRLIEEGAVTDAETGHAIADPNSKVEGNKALRIGKRRFIKIVV